MKRKARVAGLIGAGAVVLFLGASVWLHMALNAETYDEIPFNKALAAAVVTQVQAGNVRLDKAGQVHLAHPLGAAAIDGVVTVHHGKAGLMLVFFPTRHERFGVRGYLYCSRPLTGSDMVPFSGSQGIAIKSSDHPSNDGITTHGLGETIVVPLTSQLDAHWWRIAGSDQEV